ncbi:hypothetical protein C7E25_21625, partial [Stenotrophomonas maltophilia]
GGGATGAAEANRGSWMEFKDYYATLGVEPSAGVKTLENLRAGPIFGLCGRGVPATAWGMGDGSRIAQDQSASPGPHEGAA